MCLSALCVCVCLSVSVCLSVGAGVNTEARGKVPPGGGVRGGGCGGVGFWATKKGALLLYEKHPFFTQPPFACLGPAPPELAHTHTHTRTHTHTHAYPNVYASQKTSGQNKHNVCVHFFSPSFHHSPPPSAHPSSFIPFVLPLPSHSSPHSSFPSPSSSSNHRYLWKQSKQK